MATPEKNTIEALFATAPKNCIGEVDIEVIEFGAVLQDGTELVMAGTVQVLHSGAVACFVRKDQMARPFRRTEAVNFSGCRAAVLVTNHDELYVNVEMLVPLGWVNELLQPGYALSGHYDRYRRII